jgi:hypothetical protein
MTRVELPHFRFPFTRSPDVLTNHVTNPVLELTADGYAQAGYAAATFARAAVPGYPYGIPELDAPWHGHGYSLHLRTLPPNSGNFTELTVATDVAAEPLAWPELVAGDTWRFGWHGYVENYTTVPGGRIDVFINWLGADEMGDWELVSQDTATLPAWGSGLGDRDFYYDSVVPEGALAASLAVRFYGDGGAPTEFDAYMSGFYFQKGAVFAYGDGDQDGWTWLGDEHDSASSRNVKVGVVEQDSAAHILGCENVLVRCPIGFRHDRPEYGIPWPEYHQAINVADIQSALQRQEPRSHSTVTEVEDLVAMARGERTVTVEVDS